jgi:hypothetical protein
VVEDLSSIDKAQESIFSMRGEGEGGRERESNEHLNHHPRMTSYTALSRKQKCYNHIEPGTSSSNKKFVSLQPYHPECAQTHLMVEAKPGWGYLVFEWENTLFK